MATWIHCDNATKEIVSIGMSPTAEQAQANGAPEGQSLFVLADGVLGNIFSGAPSLAKLAATMQAKIDAEAEATRLLFITPGAGQMMSYIQKREEASAWTLDNNAVTPVISAEAAALGKTVAEIVADVQASAALWIAGEALINATRLGAKKALSEADNIPDIVAAAAIDWAALAASIVSQA